MSCIKSRIRLGVGLEFLVSINMVERRGLKPSLFFSLPNLCINIVSELLKIPKPQFRLPQIKNHVHRLQPAKTQQLQRSLSSTYRDSSTAVPTHLESFAVVLPRHLRCLVTRRQRSPPQFHHCLNSFSSSPSSCRRFRPQTSITVLILPCCRLLPVVVFIQRLHSRHCSILFTCCTPLSSSTFTVSLATVTPPQLRRCIFVAIITATADR